MRRFGAGEYQELIVTVTEPQPGDRKTIAILAATSIELMPTVQTLNLKPTGGAWIGESPTARVIARVTGMGPTSAAAALLRLLDHAKVAAILSIGFAGGLERGLTVGELLDIRWIINAHGEVLDIRAGVPKGAENLIERTPLRSLLSVDSVVTSPVAKRRLYEKHLAASVDMESHQLAKVAGSLGIPFFSVRVVSDPADMALPVEAARWVTPEGEPDKRAACRDLFRRPTLLPVMLRLNKNARLCAQVLARHTKEIVRREVSRQER